MNSNWDIRAKKVYMKKNWVLLITVSPPLPPTLSSGFTSYFSFVSLLSFLLPSSPSPSPFFFLLFLRGGGKVRPSPPPQKNKSATVLVKKKESKIYFLRDWSLITEKGGYKTGEGGGGAREVLPLLKGGGAEKV